MLTKRDYENSVVIELYKQLEKLFGQGSQVFSMEYPPRNLNARDYAYTIEDNTGVLFKPQQVAEAEFNLSDNMIDLAPIVQGSTGERVSHLFKSVLNNYIPRLHYAARLAEEKGKLKQWLLESIEGHVLDYNEKKKDFESADFQGTRMEYSARLYRTYLYKRQDYNKLINTRKSEAQREIVTNNSSGSNGHNSEESFADWLSTVAATKEEILGTFYNDAVVRGNLHEVNSAISFLDIPSLGQRINEIKKDLRANVKRSVIGGGDIYTVNFSPSNWFESLIKAPSPIDVVSNSSYRELQIESKNNELNNARQQLSSLQMLHVSKDQQAQLESEINSLTKEIDAAYVEIRSKYQERLVTAVRFAQDALTKTARFAIAASSGGIGAALMAEIKQTAEKKARITSEDEKSKISEIADQTKSTISTFVKLDRARQQNIELQSKLALARSSDYESQIKMLQHQINKLTEDLRALESEDALLPSSVEQLHRDIKFSGNKIDPATKDTNEQELIKEINSIDDDEQERNELEANALKEPIKTAIDKINKLKYKDELVFGKKKDLSVKDINAIILPTDKKSPAVEKQLEAIKDELNQSVETVRFSIETTLENKKNSKIVSLAKRLGLGNAEDKEEDYYQTIIIDIDKASAQSYADSSSQASESGKSFDYWFKSGSQSSKSSSSSTQAQSASDDLKIQLKLRATKVNIERGGWFGVDLLRLTEGMFHVDPNLKSAIGTEEAEFRERGRVTSSGKFSHYPMSFIIVKDVEIIKSSTEEFKSNQQDDSSSTSSSRKDSWFSSSHNESSHKSHHSRTINNKKVYFETISLPNPSILGWFQNIVPKDQSIEYGSDVSGASEEEFSKVVTKFLKSVVFDNKTSSN